MSTIMFKSDEISLTKNKEVYRIKVADSAKYRGIELPISFDGKELSQFSEEVKKLYDNIKVGTWFGVLEVEAKKGVFSLSKESKIWVVIQKW
ncbi:MAG: hypothetical protein V1818_00415 [Candidatus Aenigmatarchaeota archaeon]